jgi:hypothetical protein
MRGIAPSARQRITLSEEQRQLIRRAGMLSAECERTEALFHARRSWFRH